MSFLNRWMIAATHMKNSSRKPPTNVEVVAKMATKIQPNTPPRSTTLMKRQH